MDVQTISIPAPDTAAAVIEPMLALSTGHLTDETCNGFLPEFTGPAWRKGDYGWFVYVLEDDDGELPTDLLACMTLAREKGAYWIMFDCDEAEVDELPFYDW